LRSLSFVVATSIGVGSILSLGMRTAGAHPTRAVLVSPQRQSGSRRPLQRNRFNISEPTRCNASSSTGFVGAPSSAGDVAGGTDSAVLGGNENAACEDESGIGAGFGNLTESPGNYGAFIAGGEDNYIDASYSFIGAGIASEVSGDDSFIGGGDDIYAVAQGVFPTVVGNQVGGQDSFVGAGDLNSVSGNASFIGAGGAEYAMSSGKPTAPGNQITGTDSFIGAGDQNVINATEAFIGSGGVNTISGNASYATILGGNRNAVAGEYASILGGFGNSASGAYAIVAGGDGDTAGGTLSFAAGYHAAAVHDGSFVWSDYSSGSATVRDAAANQFVVRASGGVHVYSNEAATSGVVLNAGSGTWASLSDRNAKTGIVPLDDAAILAKVAALPIDGWQYKSEKGVRHVGPMAQDFYAAFHTGSDDRHITSIDEDGVALAAVKALNAKLDRENRKLHDQNGRLEARLSAIEGVVKRIVAKVR
jgi:hypothetical protein